MRRAIVYIRPFFSFHGGFGKRPLVDVGMGGDRYFGRPMTFGPWERLFGAPKYRKEWPVSQHEA